MVIVPVPEADPAVETFQARLHRIGACSVPAHVTVLAPFMRAAAHAISAQLPITATIRAAHLFQGCDVPGAWHNVAELSLG